MEREESDTRSEELNVHSYIQKQGNLALGWHKPPPKPLSWPPGGNMQCSLADQKVFI